MTDRKKKEHTQEEKDEANRRFFRRLADWSDPASITIIRDGVELETSVPAEPVPTPPLTVVSTDAVGNLLGDGTIVVPKK